MGRLRKSRYGRCDCEAFNKLKVDEKSSSVLLSPKGPTKNDNLGRHVQELATRAVPLSQCLPARKFVQIQASSTR